MHLPPQSTWMVGKRKQNYYSMHYIQKYKQNLEIEILALSLLTHTSNVFLLMSISCPVYPPHKIPEMKTMFNFLSPYPLLFLFTLIL